MGRSSLTYIPFLAHLAFRPCELLPSLFVRRPSVNISHFNLLLRNHWGNCNQTLVEWSLGGPLPKLCPLSSAVAAILVGGLKCRTHFSKGTIQGSFQQRLVQIVSDSSFRGEDFFKISSPFFLFLAWQPSWLEVGITHILYEC
jgi:hypothetical protein